MDFLGIHITQQDIIPSNEFDLSWRFTDAKYNLLSEEERLNLKPLGKDIASTICNRLLTYFDCEQPPFFSDKVKKQSSCNANLDVITFNKVQEWLTSHLDADCEIIISWGNDCG